jgi:hypothetical protein
MDRDAIIEFIENHKKMIAVGLGFALLTLILTFVISVVASNDAVRKSALAAETQKKSALLPEELWFPQEPLSVPGVQLSRATRAQWTAEDAKRWYTVPDEASLEGLRAASQKQIDELLESVP